MAGFEVLTEVDAAKAKAMEQRLFRSLRTGPKAHP
jgi:hypothetical protein